MEETDRDKVKELVHLAALGSVGEKTCLHLHAMDVSRCTDRNSSGEVKEGYESI